MAESASVKINQSIGESRDSGILARWYDWLSSHAAEPLGKSRRLLAITERRAAKHLWSASARLGRMANRLETAGLAMTLRDGEAPISAPPSSPKASAAAAAGEFGDEEFCPPHLA